MIARTQAPLPTIEWEDVDLSTMTADELRREQVQVKNDIAAIEFQLADEEGVYRLGIDYPNWRRRARGALRFRIAEARVIGQLLMQRQQEESEARRQARRDAALARSERAAARTTAQLSALGGPDELLSALLLAFQHLSGERNELPPAVTADDRMALNVAARYLRTRCRSAVAARGVEDS